MPAEGVEDGAARRQREESLAAAPLGADAAGLSRAEDHGRERDTDGEGE